MKLFFNISLEQTDGRPELPKNCNQGFTEPVSMFVNFTVVSTRLSNLEKIDLKAVKHSQKMLSHEEFKKQKRRFYQLPLFL